MTRPRWVLVIPVKDASRGKSRLTVPGVERQNLARAIALDTIVAAVACDRVDRVLVVSTDPVITREARGVDILADPGPLADPGVSGLNAAAAHGIATVDPQRHRGVLLGDLPALTPSDLAQALDACAHAAETANGHAVVADAEGTGSTLVAAAPTAVWRSVFGPDSFARHRALGFARADIPATSTVRRDVDTELQLRAAAAQHTLGAHTTTVLSAARTLDL